MKILFVTNLYPTKNNPDFGVFTKDQIEALMYNGVRGDVLFINAREKGVKEYLKAIRHIREIYKDYNLIHCFHGLTLLCTFISTKRIPILISFLNELKYESFKKNKMINHFIVLAYKLIIRSKRVYKIFKDKLPSNPIENSKSFHLPNGVDLKEFHSVKKEIAIEKLGLSQNINYVLFVSSKDIDRHQKRFDIFKETMSILKSKYKQYNIQELLMTNVPRDLVIYYYNAASVHLLTSDYEGSPNSIKESMACNTPVVSTDVGNVKQMISGAHNCIISDQNPCLLADNVIKVLTAPFCDLRVILEKNKLTKEDKTEELMKIYEQIYDETKFEI